MPAAHGKKGKSPVFGPTYGFLWSAGKNQGEDFPCRDAPLLSRLFPGGKLNPSASGWRFPPPLSRFPPLRPQTEAGLSSTDGDS